MYLINKYITQRFLYTDFYIYLDFKIDPLKRIDLTKY